MIVLCVARFIGGDADAQTLCFDWLATGRDQPVAVHLANGKALAKRAKEEYHSRVKASRAPSAKVSTV